MTTTKDEILTRMLSEVPDTIDKREGSLIYYALAPTATELEKVYEKYDEAQLSISLDDATGDDLTDLCAQSGTDRKAATYALRKGEFSAEVPIGNRFGLSETTYVVLSNISGFNYILQCEQAGTVGNSYSGTLLPITHIDGLQAATLTDILTAGANEESDDELRARHRQNIADPAQDGNAAQYRKWATDYSTIGIARVLPLWAGGNTVKVVITNRSFLPAEETLVTEFQEYMDPESAGLGNGAAPLGSKVTISGGISKEISVSSNVILAEGYAEPLGAAEAIASYLASITFVKTSVSYMRIGGALLDCDSISDINSLTINSGTVDIALGDEEIPQLPESGLTLTVVTS